MAYKTLTLSAYNKQNNTVRMPVKGINNQVAAEFQTTQTAQTLKNFVQDADGVLKKIKGKIEKFVVAGQSYNITMLEKFNDNFWIFAYNTTVAYYDVAGDSVTNLKTDFGTGNFVGKKFGDYFYVTNGTTKVFYITFALSADLFDENDLVIPTTPQGSGTLTQAYVTGGNKINFTQVNPTITSNLVFTQGEKYIFNMSYGQGTAGVVDTFNLYISDPFDFIFEDSTFLKYSTLNKGYVIDNSNDLTITFLFANQTAIGGVFSPSGTIDGVNKVFDLGNPVKTINDIIVDGVSVYNTEAWIVDGTTLTLVNAPTASISVDRDRYTSSLPSLTINSIKQVLTDQLEIAELADSPIAKYLEIYNNRLVAGNLIGQSSTIKWSEAYLPTTTINEDRVPFTNFTSFNSPLEPADPYGVEESDLGEFNAFGLLGQQLVLFYQDGIKGIRIITKASAVGQVQETEEDFKYGNAGGYRALSTKNNGLFYVNSGGVHQMVSGGSLSIPYSSDERNISDNLGIDKIESLDFTDAALAYDEIRNYLLVAVDENSVRKTFIYNLKTDAWSEIDIYDIYRFMKDGPIIYGTASDDTVTVYELFNSNANLGEDITSTIKQEYQMPINTRNQIVSMLLKGEFNSSNDGTVSFDIYTVNRILKSAISSFSFTGSGVSTKEESISKPIRFENFSRLIITITETSQEPFELTYYQPKIIQQGINQIY